VAEHVVAVPAALLHPLAGFELGKDPSEQPAIVEHRQALLNGLGHEHLDELVPDPFHGDHRWAQAVGLAPDGAGHLRIQREPQRCREPDGTKHSQRVLAEGEARFERRDNPARRKVVQSPAGQVEHGAIPIHQQGVDREVAPHHVALQRARAHLRLATGPIVSLAPRRHELDGISPCLHARRPESLEDDRWMDGGPPGEGLRERDALSTFDEHVDLLDRQFTIAPEQSIPHIAPDDERARPEAACLGFDHLEQGTERKRRRGVNADGHAGLEAARTRPHRSIRHRRRAPAGRFEGRAEPTSRMTRPSIGASAAAAPGIIAPP